MKNKLNKQLYSLRIQPELLERVKLKAETNFTTVTQYIIDLINKDMKNE